MSHRLYRLHGIFVMLFCAVFLAGCDKKIVDSTVRDSNYRQITAEEAGKRYYRSAIVQTIIFDDNSTIVLIRGQGGQEPVGRGKRVQVWQDWLNDSYKFYYPDVEKNNGR